MIGLPSGSGINHTQYTQNKKSSICISFEKRRKKTFSIHQKCLPYAMVIAYKIIINKRRGSVNQLSCVVCVLPGRDILFLLCHIVSNHKNLSWKRKSKIIMNHKKHKQVASNMFRFNYMLTLTMGFYLLSRGIYGAVLKLHVMIKGEWLCCYKSLRKGEGVSPEHYSQILFSFLPKLLQWNVTRELPTLGVIDLSPNSNWVRGCP